MTEEQAVSIPVQMLVEFAEKQGRTLEAVENIEEKLGDYVTQSDLMECENRLRDSIMPQLRKLENKTRRRISPKMITAIGAAIATVIGAAAVFLV
ncbi:MAG: hypothetical protein ACYS76_15460 [Planctomycetota bacterium]|jgi:hypothetical protein